MATLTLSLAAFMAGLVFGAFKRERENQREWRDYQAFLEEQRKAVSAKFDRKRLRPGDDYVIEPPRQ